MDVKKIQFGFSKVKKPNIVKVASETKEAVEFVDTFDGAKGQFSFKGNVRLNEPVKKILVIPMPGTATAYDVIKAKLETENGDPSPVVKEQIPEVLEPKVVENSQAQPTLEELATKELLANIGQEQDTNSVKNNFVIEQSSKKAETTAAVESTLEDYESIPVDDYGLAMLRGMGWKPDKGVGKNERVVKPFEQKLRPKGLGLGADKALPKPSSVESDLKICVKGYVKVVSGVNKSKYGIIDGLDEDTGRAVINLALGGVISTTESVLVPVSKKDYDLNSKVLNSVKYEEYKEISDRKLEKLREDIKKEEKNEKAKSRRDSSGDISDDDRRGRDRSRRKDSTRDSSSDKSSLEDSASDTKHKKKHSKKSKKQKQSKSRSRSKDRTKSKYKNKSRSPSRHRHKHKKDKYNTSRYRSRSRSRDRSYRSKRNR